MRYNIWLLVCFIMSVVVSGCGVPTRIITQRDTTYLERVVTLKDTIIKHHIERELVQVVSKDTASAETHYARAIAFQDSASTFINLRLENKEDAIIPIKLSIPQVVTTEYKQSVIREPISTVNEQYIKWWHIMLSILISLVIGFILGKILRF